MFAGIEAGGTKFVVGVGDAAGRSRRTATIPTRDPDATLAEVHAFLAQAQAELGPIRGIGIASFGPLELDPALPNHGRITTTPKPGWAGADMLGKIAGPFGVPAAIDTDVNAAALAEAALRGAADLAYVTVGTGIGVGLVVGGRSVRGFGHPELGHMLPRRHPAHGDFAGTCPFHGDCLEGLASGPAVIAAWGDSFRTLPADHPAWEVEADYLAQLCAQLVLTTAPEAIVLGGGVLQQSRLLAMTRARTRERLAGYCERWQAAETFERRIVPPACREPSGLIGAYLLARMAVEGVGR